MRAWPRHRHRVLAPARVARRHNWVRVQRLRRKMDNGHEKDAQTANILKAKLLHGARRLPVSVQELACSMQRLVWMCKGWRAVCRG